MAASRSRGAPTLTLTAQAIQLFRQAAHNTVGFYRHLMVIAAHPSEYDAFANFRAYLAEHDFCTWERYRHFIQAHQWFGRHVTEPLEFFGLDACLEIMLQPVRGGRRRQAVNVIRVWVTQTSPGQHPPTRQKAKALINQAFGHAPRARVHFTAEEYAGVEARHNETGRRLHAALNEIGTLRRYIRALTESKAADEALLQGAGLEPTPRPAVPACLRDL